MHHRSPFALPPAGNAWGPALLLCLALILVSVLPPEAGAGPIYTWRDASGRMHISDFPPPNQVKEEAKSNHSEKEKQSGSKKMQPRTSSFPAGAPEDPKLTFPELSEMQKEGEKRPAVPVLAFGVENPVFQPQRMYVPIQAPQRMVGDYPQVWKSFSQGNGLVLYFVLGGVVLYFCFSTSLFFLARSFSVPAWPAWFFPINLYVMVRCAGKPWWLAILFLIPFFWWVDYFGLVAVAVGIVDLAILAGLWTRIAARTEVPSWIGTLILVPVVQALMPLYLAWRKKDSGGAFKTTMRRSLGACAVCLVVAGVLVSRIQYGWSFPFLQIERTLPRSSAIVITGAQEPPSGIQTDLSVQSGPAVLTYLGLRTADRPYCWINVHIPSSGAGGYVSGRLRIEQVLTRHGENVLADIPLQDRKLLERLDFSIDPRTGAGTAFLGVPLSEGVLQKDLALIRGGLLLSRVARKTEIVLRQKDEGDTVHKGGEIATLQEMNQGKVTLSIYGRNRKVLKVSGVNGMGGPAQLQRVSVWRDSRDRTKLSYGFDSEVESVAIVLLSEQTEERHPFGLNLLEKEDQGITQALLLQEEKKCVRSRKASTYFARFQTGG